MASQKHLLRMHDSVALVEERIYVLVPELPIEITYSVSSKRNSEGVSFSTLDSAVDYFDAEVILCTPEGYGPFAGLTRHISRIS